MVRTLALPLALLLTSGLAAQETLIVHFPLASAELGAKDEAELRALCDRADIARVTGITLKGHTDVRGSAAYNEALSESRAEAVRAILRNSCLREVIVNSAWSGEMEPLSDALTEYAHADNRRTEVQLEFGNGPRSANARRHPKVVPLMPMADVPVQLYTIDPSAPIEFIAADGVRVRMSADAIVDEAGNAVRGPVEISYRSFNSGWDAIASGVPMHVGHGPDAGHMESLGMFEVYATQAGRPLQLRDGEASSLTPPSPLQRTSDYRDWTLDEATGEWREVQTITPAAPTAPMYTSALSAACAQYMKDMEDMPAMPDTTHFLTRLASEEYCYLTPCSPTGMPYARDKDQLISPYANRDVPAIQVELVRGAYRWQGVTGFRIVLAQERTHTEWLAFPRDRVWAYDGPLSTRAFNTRIARRHFYQDILFEQTGGSDRGIIRLKDRGQWVELPVDLSFVRTGKRDSSQWRLDLRTYTSRLQAKQKRFDHRLDEKVGRTRDGIIRMKAKAWNGARRVMLDAELAMTAQEFHAYAEKAFRSDMQQLFASTMGAYDNMAASFAMRGFGMYNCDRIMQRDAVAPSVVAVVDAEGTPFRWTKAYGVIEGQKAVITYWGNGEGRDDSMLLSRKMSSLLFIGANGKMLIAHRPGDVARGSKLVLQGEPMEQPKSADELQALASAR